MYCRVSVELRKNPLGKNYLGWKRPRRSSSSTINPALSSTPPSHVPRCHIYTTFKYLQGWCLKHSQSIPMFHDPLVKIFFLVSNLKLPWQTLRPFSLLLSLVTWEKRLTSHLALPPSFQTVVERGKNLPGASKLPQLFLIRLLFQSFHQLCGPSVDILQLLNIFLIERDPKLNMGFRVQPYPGQVQGGTTSLVLLGPLLLIKARLPLGSWPPGYTLAHVQLLVTCTPKSFLTRQL